MPAVVGSWPEPFADGFEGKRYPTELTCAADVVVACKAADGALRDAGAELTVAKGGDPRSNPDATLRVLVGTWDEVRRDPAARMLEQGTGVSGVYARPVACRGGWGLDLLGVDGNSEGTAAQAGWVAATRDGNEQPTWVVSGTTPEQVGAAANLLGDASLRDHYAVATVAGGSVPLPADAPVSGAAGCTRGSAA